MLGAETGVQTMRAAEARQGKEGRSGVTQALHTQPTPPTWNSVHVATSTLSKRMKGCRHSVLTFQGGTLTPSALWYSDALMVTPCSKASNQAHILLASKHSCVHGHLHASAS